MKKIIAITSLALAVSAGAASAATNYRNHHNDRGYGNGHGYGYSRITPYERAQIARSKANLDRIVWRARADGRVTAFERVRISLARNRHQALVARAYRT